MTVMSTPACSSAMAAECRRTWGVTCLAAMDGHVLAAAAEFERSLILERTKAGRMRYKQDCEKGRVGKTIHSRSGKNLPPNRPQGVFGRDEIHSLRRRGCSLRQIAQKLGIGLGTVTRTLQSAAKVINRTT